MHHPRLENPFVLVECHTLPRVHYSPYLLVHPPMLEPTMLQAPGSPAAVNGKQGKGRETRARVPTHLPCGRMDGWMDG